VEGKQAHEILAEYRSPESASVLQVRGSLLASSLGTLRELKLLDRYLGCLPKSRHDEVMFVLASSWVPLDLAMAHYQACDEMALTETELDAIGKQVSQRIMGTFLGTLVRSSQKLSAGAPTSVPLRQYPRLWDRIFVGGSCNVRMTGMKDARIESYGVPMFRYRYFRVAYAGLLRGAGLMFRSVMHARVRKATDDSAVVELSWV
jgi:hypothetical protein